MRYRPLIMGVLNVTPDSFSDGGLYFDCDSARKGAEQMWREGADIIDIGGESTRPGAQAIGTQEEMDRVLPVIEAVNRELAVDISIDTRKPEVAREAVRLGASIINDITAGSLIRASDFPPGTRFILMHLRGTPAEMNQLTDYTQGVVTEVAQFLRERVRGFEEAGVSREHLWVDPGIGFAKRPEQSLELLRRLDEFANIGGRLVIGTSRKSFLSHLPTDFPIELGQREAGTIASNLWAYTRGASVFRVHTVGEFRRALTTWEAIENAG